MSKTLASCRPRLLALTFALTLALPAAGCRKQPGAGSAPAPTAQLALKPAAAARAELVAEIVLPSPQRTFTNIGAVAKKLGLPFTDQDVTQMLIAKSELPPGVVDKIDLTKPAVVAILLAPKPEPGEPVAPVLAFALKDTGKAGLDAFVAAAGKVVGTDQDAVHVSRGDAGKSEDFWMVSRDGAVSMAESKEALIAGGALALEARRTVSEDVRIAFSPEGMARASGTTLKEALAQARAGLAQQQAAAATMGGKGDPKMQASSLKAMESIVGIVFDAISDTTEGRLGLSLDVGKGLGTTFELVPRSGSPFAKWIGVRKPYLIDPALLAGGPPGGLMAMGDSSVSREMFNAMRGPLLEALVPQAERAKVSAGIDELFAALSGPASARFAFGAGPKLAFEYDVVYGLKPGTDGPKVLATIEELCKAPWLAKAFDAALSGMKVKIASKREGEELVTKVSFDTKKMPAAMRAEFKNVPFFDGTPMEGRTALAGERLVMAIGPTAKARMAALKTAGAAPAPAGDLATALTETKDADGLYYADLAALLKPILGFAAAGGGGPNPGMMGMAGAMLENARLATWASYRGGDTMAINWRIPMSTFESVSTMFKQVTGMGGQ